MSPSNTDPSVEGEPHFGASRGRPAEDQRIDHSVWSEPGISADLAGGPAPGDLTYAEWLELRRRQTSGARTWLITLGVALSAGPWAVLGALYGSGQTMVSILAIVIFGPVIEETMKAAIATYLVERRPFYFRSPGQIAVCLLAAGAAFAVLENLMYLLVYFPDASPGLIVWRWTVCTSLHMVCSLIVGLGLVRVWRDTWARRARPKMALMFPYMIGAVLLHGLYNGSAVVLEMGKDWF